MGGGKKGWEKDGEEFKKKVEMRVMYGESVKRTAWWRKSVEGFMMNGVCNVGKNFAKMMVNGVMVGLCIVKAYEMKGARKG